MNRSIVCGVDGTQASRWAARVAGEVARELDRALVLAYVAEDPPTFPYGDTRLRELRRRETIEAATPMLERTAAAVPDVMVETRVVFGDPVDALIAVGLEKEAELMVVGSRGRGQLASVLLGSVSGRLAAIAPCPVVVVPSPDAADSWLAGSVSRALAAIAPVPVVVVPPTATTNPDREVADAAVTGVLRRARHWTVAAADHLTVSHGTARMLAAKDGSTGRFSTGIEQLPATRDKLHVGSFGDGISRLPKTAVARRVGSFADSYDGASS